MDRHDVSQEVTAEVVAQLHQRDLKIQDRFQCRGLTYWFDEKRKAAFCLVEAPSKKAIQEMHQFAHGDVPTRIIEVDPKIVEAFLGRIEDPRKATPAELNIIDDSAFRTVVALALKPFYHTGVATTSPDPSAAKCGDAIMEQLHGFGGNLARHSEGTFLASFKSASRAVQASLDISRTVRDLQAEAGRMTMALKIGLAAGVPVTKKKLLFEEVVKLAERMCMSVKGSVILSSEVRALYESETPEPLPQDSGVVALRKRDENFLTQLLDCIESSCCDAGLKMDDLSRRLGYSKSQLYREMISLTGISPQAFVNQYRLTEALKLIRTHRGNISEIAYQTGFTSPSYFSKCFRKMYGYSPSEAFFPSGGPRE
jgi:AraC-like DNA-binding protein